MAKNYLTNLEIPANILSKRDSAYNLNVGDMALVYVYVPQEYAARANDLINEWRDPEEGEVVYLDAEEEQTEKAKRLLNRNSIPSEVRKTVVENQDTDEQILYTLSVSKEDEDEARRIIAEWDANKNE
jgi:leucyl aminopeptidase (aminopeptidase T)